MLISLAGYYSSIWSPARLFADGQQGMWLEASPTYKGQQVLWQDDAGTTAVTADNDPVGRDDDLSPNDNHATQPTSADRPTYKTDGTLHWMAFDGAGDNLKTADFGLVQPCTIIVAFYPTSIGEFISDGLATNAGSFFIDTKADFENTLRAWAGRGINSPNTVTYNAWNIGTVVLDGANSIVRLNAMETVGDAGTANPLGITLGWSGGLASNSLNGRIAGVVARQGRLSSDEISNAEDELNKLVGGGVL